jgi:hypothetical protein
METAKKTKQKKIVKNLGRYWGKSVQEFLTKEGADLGRALLKAGKYAGQGTIEVKLPVSFHLSFVRKGKGIAGGAATVRCACTYKEYPDGSSVCTCTGPDAASCDCDPIVA